MFVIMKVFGFMSAPNVPELGAARARAKAKS